MTPSAAILILQALADGLDPATGQSFPADSPYQRADTVRALHAALEALHCTPPTANCPLTAPPSRPVDPDKPAAGQKWTPEEDQRLRDAFAADTPIRDLATAHGRTRGAINARLLKLGLITITSPASPLPTANCTLPTDGSAVPPLNPLPADAFPF